jgi:hypothetical protein
MRLTTEGAEKFRGPVGRRWDRVRNSHPGRQDSGGSLVRGFEAGLAVAGARGMAGPARGRERQEKGGQGSKVLVKRKGRGYALLAGVVPGAVERGTAGADVDRPEAVAWAASVFAGTRRGLLAARLQRTLSDLTGPGSSS